MGKSDPNNSNPYKQQSVILVPADTPGVTIHRMLSVMGFDDAPHGHGHITFTNVRVHKSNMTSRMLHMELLATIREEYEHNVTQQIYVSDRAWQQVKMAKEETLRIINIAYEQTGDNPSGTAWTDAEMQQLAALLRPTEILLISDEVYEHMVYDGAQHLSLARDPELAARSIVIASFGKTFHATGWKVGYALAPREISDEIRRVHQFTVFTVNSAVQHALAEFLREPARYETLPAFFAAKRDLLRGALAATPLDLLPCRGSYFQLARYGRVSDESALAFAQRLVREFGVATIPLSAFYQDGTDHRVIRFCFAKRDQTLLAAAERLQRL